MAATILIPDHPLHDIGVAREMLPRGYELIVAPPGSAEYRAALPQIDYFVGLADESMDDSFYRSAPRLKLVQLVSAGYDRADIEAARRARVPIANNGGANAVAVAEHAIMLMLAVSRRLIWQHQNVAAGRWRGNNFAEVKLYELRGRKLGIVGLGTIGKKVARLAAAFGLAVLYYDIVRLSEEAEDAIGVRFRLLEELLRSADIVSLHVPLTATTRHMIGAPELALMKSSAYLINTCRGPVVDEAALEAALREGRVAGAGLDVFAEEPPAPDNPLFASDNVILTPHLAGPTHDNQFTRFRNAYDNVERVARGEVPLWVIPEMRG